MRRTFLLQLYAGAPTLEEAFEQFAKRFERPAPALHHHHCMECGTVTNCGSDMCRPPQRTRMRWCSHCKVKTKSVTTWHQDPREDAF